jgi:hypothetical protein
MSSQLSDVVGDLHPRNIFTIINYTQIFERKKVNLSVLKFQLLWLLFSKSYS